MRKIGARGSRSEPFPLLPESRGQGKLSGVGNGCCVWRFEGATSMTYARRRIVFFLCATALIVFAPLPGFVRTPMAVSPGKIPLGTVIPISLEHALSSKDLTKGEPLEGRSMQDVTLPDREKIPGGSKIFGSVLRVTSSQDGMASITFRLDRIDTKHESYNVVTGLRTMAPFTDVQSAQLPRQAGSESASAQWATTVQIGGDFR